jgi:surfactin family lipopeptide synthetase A
MSIIRLLADLKKLGVSIRLQDDKLTLHAPRGKLPAGLLNELKEKKEEVMGFLRGADAAGSYVSIEPIEKKEYYVLSSQQKRLYFIRQMSPESTAYNIPMEMFLRPGFAGDKERIESILGQLICRHESLRTSFAMVDGQPVQRIHEEAAFEIEYYDLTGGRGGSLCPPFDQDKGGRGELPLQYTEIKRAFIRPFDLSKAPLLRSCIIKKNDNHYTWVMDMHHITADGTSQYILEKEIAALYRGEALPGLKVQYKDYSEWQHRGEQQKLREKQEKYWLNEFFGEIPVLNLPADFPRPMVQSFAGRQLRFFINKGITGMLKEFCREKEVTLYMVLLCVFTILLSKLGGQEDIIVGTPTAGRGHADLQGIFGMFVNTLVMRNFPVGDKGFAEFLEEVKTRTLAAYENQAYQFEDLVDRVSVRRDTGRNPLFDVTFNLMPRPDFQGDKAGVDAEATGDGGECSANFDVMFQGVEINGMIYFTVNYCTKLFRKVTIEKYIDYFKKILAEIKKNAAGKLFSIEIISAEEKKRLLVDFNDTASGYPRDKTIHELFAQQAEKTPDSVSVVGAQHAVPLPMDHVSLTYKELNQKSDQLAHLLREKGVGPGTVVGIMVERSIEMIMGIIGILKAGGAYMPIDPDYPRERIAFMLKDSGARVLLKCNNNGPDKSEIRISKSETNPNDRNSNDQNRIAPCIVLNFEHLNFEFLNGCPSLGLSNFEIRASNFSPANMAYIIYTSGTTGRPKGCMIEHRSVVRLLVNDRFPFDFGPADVWTMFHSYCFDFSVWEMWGAFVYGGRLIIVPRMTARDPRQFLELLKKQGVTVLNQTPAAFYHFSDEAITAVGHLSIPRYVIFGGEALAPARLREWKECFPRTRLINMYGITETTVHVTFKEITDREVRLNECNIGRPIPTLSIYIMDKHLGLQPLGAAGELCVGGEGVARGYLNRPELTWERFISGSYRSYRTYRTYNSKRIYKTGDLARWLADGNLEFLGRIDQQVKIRGFRIELGEIEYCLKMHREIKEAVVIKRSEKGKQYLCAYVAALRSSAEPGSDKGLSTPGLKKYLAKMLPDYMIPAYFVEMDKIPLTANGKVDIKMLPQSREIHMHLDSAYAAPGTNVQRIIAETWQEVLNRDKVGIRDNFFDLGGNSLDSMVVIDKLQARLKREIPVISLFTYPTISLLEGYLHRGEGKGDDVPGENAAGPGRSRLIEEGKNLMRQTLIKLDEGD